MHLSLFTAVSLKITRLQFFGILWTSETHEPVKLKPRIASTPLIWCYKILFGHVDIKSDNLFEWAPHFSTTGRKYKLSKKSSSTSVRHYFFNERIECIEVWNSLPDEVNFSTVKKFYTYYWTSQF